jgi:hypothetical protein
MADLSAIPDAARPGRRWCSARYVAGLLLLLVSAASMQAVARVLRLYTTKLPVPLRQPLDRLDRGKLLPEYSLHPIPVPPLREETLETLGTRELLDWYLVDAARPRGDPERVAHVFITYYTGRPDMVPHVPDECWTAGGQEQAAAPETIELEVPGAGAPQDRIPARLLRFRSAPRRGALGLSGGEPGPPVTVVYFFLTNGRYVTTRNSVRLAQSNLWDRYAYYSKIELVFGDDYPPRRFADRDQSIHAAARLLRKLMPILLADHYADWESLQRSGAEHSATEAPGHGDRE